MSDRSYIEEFRHLPSAVLVDLPLAVPLFAVSRMSLSESYALPPVGPAAFRVSTSASTDVVSLTALLVGPQRLLWKKDLELVAASSRTGGSLGAWTGGAVAGVTLVSTLVTRTNMQVTELSFTAAAQRLDCLEVSITLRHVPQPGPVDALVDLGATAALSIVEFAT
ncbi:hypothetical protein [Raineyella sp. LH-20]|uniref:hypothetical protein n=1 Tax=Raineyella sp. LH-20 TaxID=3081204 RepID=UPI002952D856|nr:hypothetical protein [Raineyella sp. LH-20]WOP18909.1 hypothetical protein R0146_01135 [Raineyella sp. LH-20]